MQKWWIQTHLLVDVINRSSHNSWLMSRSGGLLSSSIDQGLEMTMSATTSSHGDEGCYFCTLRRTRRRARMRWAWGRSLQREVDLHIPWTLKRELKVPEIAEREANETSVRTYLGAVGFEAGYIRDPH
jgi:hypothetical protein